jgi:signal transduction histidine kinase
MEELRKASTEERAQTDASLAAERSALDTVDDERALRKGHRMADDLIERDRASADARLLQIRLDTDDLLALERADTGRAWARVTTRAQGFRTTDDCVVDDGRTAERAATDALVEGERGLADAAVALGRREHDEGQARLAANRHHTDDNLSAERSGADVTLAVLDKTKSDLAVAQLEQDRRADVLAMVTHDLQNPLLVIAMNAEHLEATTKDREAQEVLEEVSLAAARMKRLLMDLLDVVRIDSGIFYVVKRPQEINAFMAEVLLQYAPLFDARGIELELEEPGDPFVVPFDHDRIVQVLSNLLGNALKFTPRGGWVKVGVKRQTDGVQFTVRDNGPGIPLVHQPHVFERFWQKDREARRGLGLGLNICEKIVAEHGGRIWVESAVGQGATFHFSLPPNRSGRD